LAGFWKMKPAFDSTALSSFTVSSPSSETEPLDGLTSPLISRAKVVLPDPLRPITPIRRSQSASVSASSAVFSP